MTRKSPAWMEEGSKFQVGLMVWMEKVLCTPLMASD